MGKYEILTERDKQILELTEQLKVVDVFVIDTMLFKNTKTNRVAQNNKYMVIFDSFSTS